MIYLCYDTALNEEYTLVKLLQAYPDYISLFSGTDDENIWDAAPYLFKVSDNFYKLRKDEFVQLDHCILFETSETKEEVCRFLQYYMYKKTGQKTAYVRVWDARVFIQYLSVWDEKERVKIFTFFNAVYTEQENREWLDKWQLARFNKPAAIPVLKTQVLYEMDVLLSDPDGSSSAARPADVERSPAPAAEPLPPDPTNQPPKKRRFFID